MFADQIMYTGFCVCGTFWFISWYWWYGNSSEEIRNYFCSGRRSTEIQEQFQSGLCDGRRSHNKVIDIWAAANERVAKAMMENLSQEEVINREGNPENKRPLVSLWWLILVRGSAAQIRRLAGYAWFDGSSRWLDHWNPNYSKLPWRFERITAFISTHGARKGLADTALKQRTQVTNSSFSWCGTRLSDCRRWLWYARRLSHDPINWRWRWKSATSWISIRSVLLQKIF